jgi:NAD(P)-dependent dehydrogenase (short-subunit alcohol dehydrogenase family)
VTIPVQHREQGGGAVAGVVRSASFGSPGRSGSIGAVRPSGRLDTWVHKAGVLLVAGFDDTTPEEFARVLQLNLLGQVYGAKAALSQLRREGGALISRVVPAHPG